jgi:hypothetical protein
MSEVNDISASEQKKEDWMNAKWRPMMGWMYMAVCACDFMLFPVLWSIHQAMNHGQIGTQWQPLTLQGAGLFHIAMGAVLGIAAYGRTKEKMAGAENGGLGQGFGSPSPPAPSFGAPATTAPAFGAKPTGPGATSFPAL